MSRRALMGSFAMTLTDNHREFQAKLEEMARSIRVDAGGRTCGGCTYLRGSYCNKKSNIDGNPLTIFYNTAPACSGWVTRADAPSPASSAHTIPAS